MRHFLLALPLPFVLLLAGLDMLAVRGPFWLARNSDPSYVYLLSSLRVLEGRAPRHLDHPGLTVHCVGAAVMASAHTIARRPLPLSEDVLDDPEWYARVVVRTFLGLYAATMVVAGLTILRATGRPALMWLVQATPLASPSSLFELSDLKPEPLLYVVAGLAAACLCGLLAREDARRGGLVLLLGAAIGTAVATKFTAVSLIALALVALAGARDRLRCLAAAGISFALWTAPAWSEWRRAATFLSQMARGTGLYGQQMFADQVRYAEGLQRVLVEELAFFLVLLVGLAAALVARRRSVLGHLEPARRRAMAALWSLLAASGIQCVLLLKHPYQPRYLLPALGCSGLVLALAAWLACWREDGSRDARACAAVLATCVAIAALQAPRFVRRRAQLQEATRSQLAARRVAEAAARHCPLVSYYRASSPGLALFQGDAMGGPTFASRLAPKHAAEFFLLPEGQLATFAKSATVAELAARGCIVFQGSPGGPGRPFASEADFRRDTIPVSGALTVLHASTWEAVFEVRARDQAPSSTGSPLRMGSRP